MNTFIFPYFVAFLLLGSLHSQSSVDTLWVAAKSGLTMRSETNVTSKKLGSFPFNTLLSVLKTDKIDTINNRIANWYQVKGDIEGFVFGGYLNTYRLPDSAFLCFNYYIPNFVNQLGKLKKTAYYTLASTPDKEIEHTEIFQNDKLLIIKRIGYEYSSYEYYINNVHINEFINLFELMQSCYGKPEWTITPYFSYNLGSFNYAVPDAGMERNEVVQLQNNTVLIRFIWSL